MNLLRPFEPYVRLVLDFVLRRRSVALALIRSGVAVLAATMSIAFAIRARVGDIDLQFSTENNAASDWITAVGVIMGASLVLIGVCIAVWDWWHASRLATREKLIAIELRGLHATADNPLREAQVCKTRGNTEELLIDLRRSDTTSIDPHQALLQMAHLPARLAAMRSGLDRRHVRVVAGGIGPVPHLFLLGQYLDDESSTELLDWDRHERAWRRLDEADYGDRFLVTGLESVASRSPNVVVAVSVSYRASASAIATTFGEYPLVELRMPTCLPSTQWSAEQATALTRQFVEVLSDLTNKEVGTVHLVLACPAGLAIKLGMSYDRRNMSRAIVYQYERSTHPPFPWGIAMPTDGTSVSLVVRQCSINKHPSSDEVAA